MDRFHDDERPTFLVDDPLTVSNFEVTALAREEGGNQLYGVIFSGAPDDDEAQYRAIVLNGPLAAFLCSSLARVAAKSCDADFATAFLVGMTETTAESRAFLSDHLGHGEAPEF